MYVRVPMFNGNSFDELLPMENVEHKLSIDLDFKVNTHSHKYPKICQRVLWTAPISILHLLYSLVMARSGVYRYTKVFC